VGNAVFPRGSAVFEGMIGGQCVQIGTDLDKPSQCGCITYPEWPDGHTNHGGVSVGDVPWLANAVFLALFFSPIQMLVKHPVDSPRLCEGWLGTNHHPDFSTLPWANFK